MNELIPIGAFASEAVNLNTIKYQDPGTVLLLGNYRPALAIARALCGNGHTVIVGSGGGEGFTEYSHHVSECWLHPELNDDENAFAELLRSYLSQRTDIKFVYPVSEEFSDFFTSRPHLVPNHVVVVSPSPQTVTVCRDKVELLNLAEKCGHSVPPFCVTKSLEDFDAAVQHIGFPLIVRPLPPENRIGKKKAIILTTKHDLSPLKATLKDQAQKLLIQKFVPGQRQDILFAATNGQLTSAVQVKYLRTDHLNGAGLCVDGEVVELNEELLATTEKFVAALDYNGIGCAQFLVDENTGTFFLIEINPRTSALHAVTEKLGLGFSSLALQLAQNTPNRTSASLPKYKAGLKFAWSYGEIRAIVSAVRDREIGFVGAMQWISKMLKTALFADLHLTWKWSDPVPTFLLFKKQLFRRPGKSLAATRFSAPNLSKRVQPADQLTWKVFRDFSDAKEVWTQLERDAICTPFQNYNWVKSFHDKLDKNSNSEINIVVGFNTQQTPVILFPMCVKTVLGSRRLEFLGQRLNDYNMPLIRSDLLPKIDEAGMRRIWDGAVHAAGSVDYCSISRIPQKLFGQLNPFASADLQPESSDAHGLTLGAEWNSFARASFSKSTLRRLREKERKLAKLGQLESRWHENLNDKERYVELILKWKCDQLAATGARNELKDAKTASFLRKAVRQSGEEIGIFTLDFNGIPIAGIMAMKTPQGPLIYLTAYASGEHSRFSPGVILLHRLMQDSIERGHHVVDFSVGDEPYKLSLCNTKLSVWNRTEAFTWKGVLPAWARRRQIQIKRILKKSSHAMDVLQWGNKWLNFTQSLVRKTRIHSEQIPTHLETRQA